MRKWHILEAGILVLFGVNMGLVAPSNLSKRKNLKCFERVRYCGLKMNNSSLKRRIHFGGFVHPLAQCALLSMSPPEPKFFEKNNL